MSAGFDNNPPLSTFVNVSRYHQAKMYPAWFSSPEKDPSEALCRAATFKTWFLRNEEVLRWKQEFFFVFFFTGNLGHPFHLLTPMIQSLLCVWWHHEQRRIMILQHRLTNHTQHVSTTTRPYSSLILWTGTTRVGNAKKTGEGKRERRQAKREGEEGNKMKHSLDYAYICEWCLHNNTIDNHYRHSHCLLNLVYTEKNLGMGTQKGWLRGEETSIKAMSCSQHHERQNGNRHC